MSKFIIIVIEVSNLYYSKSNLVIGQMREQNSYQYAK